MMYIIKRIIPMVLENAGIVGKRLYLHKGNTVIDMGGILITFQLYTEILKIKCVAE
tara:strand:+ start:189 stop:356 length:168 start_codon:yes stop_codon:yes gene_type:complete